MIDLGQTGVWGHLDSLTIEDLRAHARRVEELGFKTLWVPETVGRHPFSLLALLVGETSSLVLGTSIVGIYGHDAQATRMAALTLEEASGHRFVLGLGVSHPHLVTKVRGHEFGRPVSAMRDFLAAYRAAPWKGPAVAAEPPILIAALRDRMLALAATDADGAFPYLVTPARVGAMRATLEAARADGPRPLLAVTCPAVLETDPKAARAAARAYLAPYLRTPTYQASWALQGFAAADWEKPASDRLVDAMVAWGDADAIRARIAELVAAGADHVAIIPISPDGLTEHLPLLEALVR